MKYRYSLFGMGLAALVFAFTLFPREINYQEKETVLIATLVDMLKQLHFSPIDLDDEFSGLVYQEYLDRIDGRKHFLIQEDIDELVEYRYLLDDEARNGTFEFFDRSVIIIENAIDRAEKMYLEVIEEDYEFNKKRSIELDADKYTYAKNEKELRQYWRDRISHEMLTRLVTRLKRQEAEDFEGEIKTEEELIEDIRKKLKNNYERRFDNLKRNRRVDWFSTYINSMVNLYDPHTGYFKPKDKQDFDLRMSGTLEGIGAQLTQDGDYIKVVNVVPGGPAWKQGDLEVDAKILKVAQEENEPLDVVGWHIDDVISKIRGKKGTKVRLTVRQPNGDVIEIPIVRDVIVFEDSYVKSFTIDHEKLGRKVGYINLPSFYASSFGSEEGRNSGEDVRMELEKLKKENVDGIVLDLRSNGGGSLRDVVEMSGLFIEEGPIVQVKSRGRRPYVLKDEDSEVVYDGPLVVLVNAFSASASEILAAAMQDYDRAVIVGANSTFGKGTVQRFYDLDRTLKGYDELKPLGNLKVTTQKFYRVDGGATQLRGVVPDIILPDPYNYVDIGEKEYDHALPWSEIEAVDYSQDVYQISDKDYLRKMSDKRVSGNETFNKIDEYAHFIKTQRDDSVDPLNLEEYIAKKEKIDKKNEEFDDIKKKIPELDIAYLLDDLESLQSDSTRMGRYENTMKRMQKDIYLEEAIAIIHDMIDKQKRNP